MKVSLKKNQNSASNNTQLALIRITDVYPASAKAGAVVTITAEGFSQRESSSLVTRIVFTNQQINDATLAVMDATTARFILPSNATSLMKTVSIIENGTVLASFDVIQGQDLITTKQVEAFADTSCFTGANHSCIKWHPKAVFDLAETIDLGIYSDQVGAELKAVASLAAGTQLVATSLISAIISPSTIYAKGPNTESIELGSYETKFPPSFSMPGLGEISVLQRDSLSAGYTVAPNCIIIGGTFSNPIKATNGMATYLAKLKPDGTFLAMENGLSDNMYLDYFTAKPFAFDSAGNMYATGTTSSQATIVMKWDGNSWQQFTTGLNSTIISITFDSANRLFATGSFSCNFGSTASGSYPARTCAGTGGTTVLNGVAQWDAASSTWLNLGVGLGTVSTSGTASYIAASTDGFIYVSGGNFLKAGGLSIGTNLARFHVPSQTWSRLGTGTASINSGSAVSIGPSGKVYVTSQASNIYAGQGLDAQYLSSSFSTASKIVTVNSTASIYPGMSASHPNFPSGTTIVSINSATTLTISNFPTATITGSNVTYKMLQAPITVFDPGTSRWSNSDFGTQPDEIYQIDFDASGRLYAVGNFTCLPGSTSTGIFPNNTCSGTGGSTVLNNIAKWDGTSWTSVGNGTNASVYHIAFDGSGDVHIGGYFNLAGQSLNSFRYSKWNGTQWTGYGYGINGAVYSMAEDNQGNIYVGGSFTVVGSDQVNYVAKWNPSTSSWSKLGEGLAGPVQSLALDMTSSGCSGTNPCIYATSVAPSKGVIVQIIIYKWNGSNWSEIGTLESDAELQVMSTDIFAHQLYWDSPRQRLYVAGLFRSINGRPANNLAAWDGSVWTTLGDGLIHSSNVSNMVTSIKVDKNGNIYALGLFDTAGTTPVANIAKWNGTAWTALSSGLSDGYTHPSLLLDSQGYLLAASYDLPGISRWDGTSWTSITLPTDYGTQVRGPMALDHNGNLVIPLEYSIAPGNNPIYLSTWDGQKWSRIETPLSADTQALFDSNGDIYFAGDFTQLGGKLRPYFAKWMTKFGESK